MSLEANVWKDEDVNEGRKRQRKWLYFKGENVINVESSAEDQLKGLIERLPKVVYEAFPSVFEGLSEKDLEDAEPVAL